jgi:hypothetical protein
MGQRRYTRPVAAHAGFVCCRGFNPSLRFSVSNEQTPPAKPISYWSVIAWTVPANTYIFLKYGPTDFAHVMEFLIPIVFLFLASIYNSSIRPGARRPARRPATKSSA